MMTTTTKHRQIAQQRHRHHRKRESVIAVTGTAWRDFDRYRRHVTFDGRRQGDARLQDDVQMGGLARHWRRRRRASVRPSVSESRRGRDAAGARPCEWGKLAMIVGETNASSQRFARVRAFSQLAICIINSGPFSH